MQDRASQNLMAAESARVASHLFTGGLAGIGELPYHTSPCGLIFSMVFGFSIGVRLPNGNASYHLVTRLYQASQKLKNEV